MKKARQWERELSWDVFCGAHEWNDGDTRKQRLKLIRAIQKDAKKKKGKKQ